MTEWSHIIHNIELSYTIYLGLFGPLYLHTSWKNKGFWIQYLRSDKSAWFRKGRALNITAHIIQPVMPYDAQVDGWDQNVTLDHPWMCRRPRNSFVHPYNRLKWRWRQLHHLHAGATKEFPLSRCYNNVTHTHTPQWISSHTWRLTSSNHSRSMCWKGPWATRGAENTSCVAWRHKWNSTYITSVPTKQAWWHRCSSAYPLDSGSTHVKCWNCWSMPISQSFMFKSVEQHWNGCEFTQHHCHQQYKSLCRKFPSTFSFYPLLVLHLFS